MKTLLGALLLLLVFPGVVEAETRFIQPQIDEFYVPITPVSTVLGAMFGSVRRQNKEIEAYWQNRRTELERANARCLELLDDTAISSCLQTNRETEIRKSEAMAQYNQQRLQQQAMNSYYLQSAGRQLMMAQPSSYTCNTMPFGSGFQTRCR